ncbi:MAG: CDP-glucose 4,6-dehydratase [Deltaproteobacteria bacterium]|nr:CDP-glucose 4,6-dehydratase [Deltaproteobacteria bacterium]
MESLRVMTGFWRDKRVLLTGHTGFKGSWLSLWLAELGAKVVGFALAPSGTPNLFDQARVGERVQSIIGDIRDPDHVAQVMRDAQPEIVLHLAAQSLVRTSYEAPVETFAVNVMGTTHVLEAARHVGSVRSVVVVTTDKCYENREWLWGYREGDALGGHDPYSTSKACVELVTSAYRRSFFTKGDIGVASARAGNVIGGGDWAKDRIVPDMARAALAGESVLVRNPRSTRPWQHVLDVLHGYLLLAERLHGDPARHADAWNFGPAAEDVRAVGDLADAVCSRWGGGTRWHHEAVIQPHEAGALTLDATKARTLLGWRPTLRFEQAVQWSIDWYKAHGDRSDLAATTLGQIQRFQELAS